MNIVKIVCRAPASSPARVFPTSPPSPTSLPLPATLFMGFHGLHPNSWLPLWCCWLSVLCGCAHEADRGRMLCLKRRYSTMEEELDGSRLLRRRRLQWLLLEFVNPSIYLGYNGWLALLYFVLTWPTFCLSMCLHWAFVVSLFAFGL
ncbi:hypothetical protein D8674_018887 [Pyrus ussuriensis x Pyrus communis]|uniref:Uncharacterized protein n=1 Tax=Pyrus ussuriensis x Pyrus communis TaxID=2448454 RepID=A0A5N5G622_9ROSA|nr:hypothetical protein D8674_018887 [Pyrus ussuriensis x Pyrus communis]